MNKSFRKIGYWIVLSGTALCAGIVGYNILDCTYKEAVRIDSFRDSFKYQISVYHDKTYYANEFNYTNGMLMFHDGYNSNEVFISTRPFTVKTQHN